MNFVDDGDSYTKSESLQSSKFRKIHNGFWPLVSHLIDQPQIFEIIDIYLTAPCFRISVKLIYIERCIETKYSYVPSE